MFKMTRPVGATSDWRSHRGEIGSTFVDVRSPSGVHRAQLAGVRTSDFSGLSQEHPKAMSRLVGARTLEAADACRWRCEGVLQTRRQDGTMPSPEPVECLQAGRSSLGQLGLGDADRLPDRANCHLRILGLEFPVRK